MRVRNVHTASIGGIPAGREGELPRNVHTVRMIGAGLLEDVAVDVPSTPPSSPPPAAEENSTELREPSPKAENSTDPPDLSGVSAKKARGLIRRTSDAELLGRWLGPETRKTVRAALEARMEDLGGSDPD